MIGLRRLVADGTYLTFSGLTVAFAVGANVAVFAIVNALWLRPSSVFEPGRVAVILRRSQALDGAKFSNRALSRFQDTGLFAGVAGQTVTRGALASLASTIRLGGTGPSQEVLGVTPSYFRVLGVEVLGRDFAANDDEFGAEPVAIISDRLWHEQFSGRVELIGSSVAATPRSLHIVGVAAPGFQGALRGEHVDLWVPDLVLANMAGVPPDQVAQSSLPMVDFCRMAPGMSLGGVQAWFDQGQRASDLDLAVVQLNRLFGSPDLPLVEVQGSTLFSLVGGAGVLVLAGGCATLMALVVAHYERRRRDFAIQLSLGLDHSALLRSLAVELSAQACIATGLAILMAEGLLRIVPGFTLSNGVDLARLDFSLDWRVLVAALAMTIGVTLVAGVLPLLQLLRSSRGSVIL